MPTKEAINAYNIWKQYYPRDTLLPDDFENAPISECARCGGLEFEEDIQIDGLCPECHQQEEDKEDGVYWWDENEDSVVTYHSVEF